MSKAITAQRVGDNWPTSQALDAVASRIEDVLINGDLSKLNASERVSYYNRVCESLGLNPLTRPFEYISLQGKMVFYAKRDATEQLRKIHGVSIEKLEKDKHDDLFVVTAYAKDKHGRTDASTGAVSLGNLKGEALANAIMKAETKAKRRVTLSICGLGLLDELEVETLPTVSTVEPLGRLEPVPSPDGFDRWLADLEAVSIEGTDALHAAWKASPVPMRAYMTKNHANVWESIKAVAAMKAAFISPGVTSEPAK